MPSTVADEAPWRGTSWTTRLVLLTLAAVAVGVLGLTGGLDRVAPPAPAQLPMVAVNMDIDAGPWHATVTNAVATTDLSPYKPRTEGNWLLAVAIRIDDTSPDALASFHLLDAVTLSGLAGLTSAEPLAMALVRDGSELEYINPGLPERVAFIFEVAKATPVPKQVVVVIKGHTAHFGWTNRRYEWSDLADRALVTVDVANKMATS